MLGQQPPGEHRTTTVQVFEACIATQWQEIADGGLLPRKRKRLGYSEFEDISPERRA